MAISVVLAPPAAPASIWASATNVTDFTVAWSSVSGATGYRLDVGTNAAFTSGGGGGGTLLDQDFNAWSGSWIDGWTHNSGVQYATDGISGTRCVGMNAASDWIQAPAVTNPGTLSFWVRTSSDPGSWTVAVQTSPNGSDWTDRATIVENGTGGTINNTYYQTNIVLNLTGTYYVRWYMSARSADSCYIDDVLITGGTGEVPAYVPGYENRNVGNVTAVAVTGLTAETTYYFRVRAVSAGGTSGNSTTGSVTTRGSGTPPVMVTIPAQTTYVGAGFDYTVSASTTEGDPILSYGCTSVVDANQWDFDMNDGYFVFYPEVEQLGTNLFNFTATDKDGTSAPVQMSVKVYSAAATNEFTQWVEDRQADPAAPGFAPDEDADGDGVSNYEEYLADTDPTSSNSVLKLEGDYFIASEVGEVSGQIEFRFPASPTRYYQLEYCTDITNQTTVVVTNLGWGVPPTMTVTSDAPATWYGTIRVLLNEP